jgi:hypothetical protein
MPLLLATRSGRGIIDLIRDAWRRTSLRRAEPFLECHSWPGRSDDELPAIILDLTFESSGIGWIVRWDSSYGPYGTIEASDGALSVALGKPRSIDTAD